MARSKSRYLFDPIRELALERDKMAFISGPRQVGKTTLAKSFLSQSEHSLYENWDEIEFRRKWAKSPSSIVEGAADLATSHPVIALDEIHKAKGWKSTLKGLYDRYAQDASFIVTGSARLNVFKKGSDSLLGRYLHFRLHPFTVGEITGSGLTSSDDALRAIFGDTTAHTPKAAREAWETMKVHGGFPEPFFAQSDRISRLWRRSRVEKIIREDLRDLSRLPELSQVEMLAALLPERVAGTLSPQSLREDLEVAHDTVKRWLGYLAELYYFFELKPYSSSIPRSLKKEGKLYLWDWAEAPEGGPRFENMVASHLLKACHYWSDTGEGNFELKYLKDKQKREIDFLIIRDKKPWLCVEAKRSDTNWSPNFEAFRKNLGNIPCLQIVDRDGVALKRRDLDYPNLVASAAAVFAKLP